MKKKTTSCKNILLTFDYELFFGKSGTLKKCILEPVQELIDFFEAHHIQATFFVDILYYLCMVKNEPTSADSRKIKEQLQLLVSKGHRIELHLHPHWLDADYHNNEWIFKDYRCYRLQNLPEEKIFELFQEGVKTLESIAREVEPDYKVIAFRAGGFCIQPFEKLERAFINCGLLVDSSVVPHMSGASNTHYYSFINAPEIEFYKFKQDPIIADSSGRFYEIPITTYRKRLSDKINIKFERIFRKSHFKIFGDGIGIWVKYSFWRKFIPTFEMLTLESTTPDLLIKNINRNKQRMINIISHPKNLSKNSFYALERLSNNGFEFLNINQAIDRIEKISDSTELN